MTATRTYLDWNASAPLSAAARSAMLDALETSGNPSSIHTEGRAQRKRIEDARASIASAVGALPGRVVFTSGASEASAFALSPVLSAGGRELSVSQLYVSAVEHPAILAGGRFSAEAVSRLPVDGDGMLSLSALEETLQSHDVSTGAAMVAVQLANSETGIIQDIGAIAEIVHRHSAFLVVDAVQAFGKIAVDIAATGAHFLIVSSHKVGGPQGAGALILGEGGLHPRPLITGGGQENYLRAGTENVAAIAGFGAAAAEIPQILAKKPEIARIRDSIEAGLSTICADAGNKAGTPVFFGQGKERLANTACFSVPGIKAETALISLDLAGVAVSSGSACSSGKVRKSHVLEAMGVNDDLARCALRVSTGPTTTTEDAGRFLGAFTEIASRVA